MLKFLGKGFIPKPTNKYQFFLGLTHVASLLVNTPKMSTKPCLREEPLRADVAIHKNNLFLINGIIIAFLLVCSDAVLAGSGHSRPQSRISSGADYEDRQFPPKKIVLGGNKDREKIPYSSLRFPLELPSVIEISWVSLTQKNLNDLLEAGARDITLDSVEFSGENNDDDCKKTSKIVWKLNFLKISNSRLDNVIGFLCEILNCHIGLRQLDIRGSYVEDSNLRKDFIGCMKNLFSPKDESQSWWYENVDPRSLTIALPDSLCKEGEMGDKEVSAIKELLVLKKMIKNGVEIQGLLPFDKFLYD